METVATPKTVKARVLRRVAAVRPIEAGRVYTAKGLQKDAIRAEISKLVSEFCWTLKTPPAKATISLFWLRENGFEALVPATADDIAVVVSRRVKGKEEDVLSLRFEQLVHYEEVLFTSPPLARVVLNEFEVKEKTGVSILAVLKKLYDRFKSYEGDVIHFEGVSTMEVGSVKCTAYANDGKVQGMEDGGEEDGEGSVEP